MIRCSFCGHNFHQESVRRIPTLERQDTDPSPVPAGSVLYACAPCLRKRARFIRQLEANRKAYGRASRRVAA